MRRIPTLVLLVAFLLLLFANGSGIAGKTAITAEQEKDQTGPWTELKSGVKVLRVWETKGSPEWPQVAVLRISEAEFKKLEANAKDYVNDHKVFPVAVNSVSMKGGCCPPLKGGDRLVVFMHCLDSSTCSICTGPT